MAEYASSRLELSCRKAMTLPIVIVPTAMISSTVRSVSLLPSSAVVKSRPPSVSAATIRIAAAKPAPLAATARNAATDVGAP